MVVRPGIPVVPVVAQRRSYASLLALCFIPLCLCLIASTIVLALIPVYLSSRSTSINNQVFYGRGATVNSLGNDGTLSASANAAIAQQLAAALGVPAGSISVPSGTVSTSGSVGRRRRRKIGLSRNRRAQTNGGTQYIFITIIFNRRGCGGRRCYITPGTYTITVTIIFNGQSFTIVIVFVISTNPFSIPPPTGTTSAISTSTSTSTTTAQVTSNLIG
jgi:hypothetical protein